MENFYKLNEKGKEYFKKQADEKGIIHAIDPDLGDYYEQVSLQEMLEGKYVLNEEYDPEYKNAIGFTEGLKYRLDRTTIFVNEELINEED